MREIKTLITLLALCILLVINDTPGNAINSFSQSIITEAGLMNTPDNPSNSRWYWDFNEWNNMDGWTLHDILHGTVTGGTLWITIQKEQKKEVRPTWMEQVWGPPLKYELSSPKGLGVPAEQYNKIIIRLRNLSPETDGFVRWSTTRKQGVDTGYIRYTMKPDLNEWQEVVCHMDNKWNGTIDQIKIQPARMWQRGDIWIDWITITNGERKSTTPRPDVCSEKVIPKVHLPGISQKDFNDAFKVLDECMVVDVPINGFNYPFMAPGGAYGENWWQLDGSLNLAGSKWANQKFAEDVIRGFTEVQAQNPDGRIDLWGGSPVRGQFAEVSSLPRYFEAAFDVAMRTNDLQLRNIIYLSMKKYLEYWLSSAKVDKKTGLVTAVFEETLGNTNLNQNNEVIYQDPKIIAPIDLNVAVAIGCYNTARLAEYLGKTEDAEKYKLIFGRLSSSINQHLWSDVDNVYYNYNVPENRHYKRLICSTFDPLLLGIAPPERVEKLIPVLLDTSQFYWGLRPVTTIARTEPIYVEATGSYDGRAWLGDVWTLRNIPIINGLEDAGKHQLAAELTWSTIKTFNANYCEYVAPGTGSGEGVQRYGWSASQYIQAIIENLFGISYNSIEKRLRITPHIPVELMNKEIEISNLQIPSLNGLVLELRILQKEAGKATITINLKGKVSGETVEICLPEPVVNKTSVITRNGRKLKPITQFEDIAGVVGVRMDMENRVEVVFE